MSKRILFICTGNYYRSRFAEVIFNRKANDLGLQWAAFSRGFRAENPSNIGPISVHAKEGLEKRGIMLPDPRFPKQLLLQDLRHADLIVALKESEHRPWMASLFPDWEHRIEYWKVDDIDLATPEEALRIIESNIRNLLDQLQRSGTDKYHTSG